MAEQIVANFFLSCVSRTHGLYLVIGFTRITLPLCLSSCNNCSRPDYLVLPSGSGKGAGGPLRLPGGERIARSILLLTERAGGLPHDLIAGARVQSV